MEHGSCIHYGVTSSALSFLIGEGNKETVIRGTNGGMEGGEHVREGTWIKKSKKEKRPHSDDWLMIV